MDQKYKIYPSGYRHIESIEGFSIQQDKHAYKCVKCGAIFQSKNMWGRSIFKTDDPRCETCDCTAEDLKQVCECNPIV